MKTESDLKYLAAAREKYSTAMRGVILRLLGVRWDVEGDMRELHKEYEDHYPLTALVLYLQLGLGRSTAGPPAPDPGHVTGRPDQAGRAPTEHMTRRKPARSGR